ncbi:MAG: hypothetical protein JST96_09925 [Bacteroidetes bacterium]|nr:hypothetical protein [Bacteroidota bacterium]
MLTEDEERFILYWEQNRDRQKRTFRQLLVGIPIGLLFAVPIFVNFVSGWYKRADMESNTQEFNPAVLLVALLLIIGFIAIFSKKHQWDMREQHYRELLAKRSKNVEKENL